MNNGELAKYRAIIIDDHPLLREGVKKILQSDGDIEVVAEAENISDLLALVGRVRPHLVVLDINLPGRSGLEALVQLGGAYPRIPVLVLSMHSEERFALRAMKAGASGYVTKSSAAGELLGAARKVIAGGRYVSSAVAEILAAGLTASPEKLPHEQLSDRELQVLTLIATGKSIREIAETIHLSINTVNTYRARILSKLDINSNAGLIRYAIDHKLVD